MARDRRIVFIGMPEQAAKYHCRNRTPVLCSVRRVLFPGPYPVTHQVPTLVASYPDV